MLSETAHFRHHFGDEPLPGYTVKVGLGKGAFGEVYLAVNRGGKAVALKLLTCAFAEDEIAATRQCINFKNEHFVEIFDLVKGPDGSTWVLMEYVLGDTLAGILQSEGRLEKTLAVAWFRQLAEVLHALHLRNILHRDVKSSNVFLEEGKIKLGDVGLCTPLEPAGKASDASQGIGTAEYGAPEVDEGVYSPRTDVYAAGILLYEMLVGDVPFRADDPDLFAWERKESIRRQHHDDYPDLTKAPREFATVLGKALAKNPAHRYPDMKTFAQEVELAARGPATVAPQRAPTPKVQAAWVGDLASVLVGAGGASFVLALLASALLFQGDWSSVLAWWLLTLATSWAIIIPGRTWEYSERGNGRRRLVLAGQGVVLGLLAAWLQGYRFPGMDGAETAAWAPAAKSWESALFPLGTLPALPIAPLWGLPLYFAAMLGLLRWWVDVHERRPVRFSLMSWLATVLVAYAFLALLPVAADRELAFFTLAMTSFAVQVASPCREVVTPIVRRLRLEGY